MILDRFTWIEPVGFLDMLQQCFRCTHKTPPPSGSTACLGASRSQAAVGGLYGGAGSLASQEQQATQKTGESQLQIMVSQELLI